MNYPALIFAFITLAASMALAYRNKTLNRRQTRKVYSEVRIIKK